ncbi:MAG: helix-turn-helix transcriptional regulator [Bacteroidia bacterium]|nr:helix-turn-helix transcriptional regulator [Bacteroidia bacterium]NNF32240.1 helix-turn-helix transcriptional regulator [Flavobacteriaceae bacterium]MBT8276703.1 helix-turn-helix transcriptional regulator [Bacteroidia bacterium]NNJ83151.1 helix-turn-helix transcriptional regulator [Flavobacteriaceae bacterium]NNK55161.1 helix-turn-helix transcriptional regulator [Flavobacteriaceae bacterium]
MNFNIFNSLILAGVIQGLLFGVVFLFNKKYRAKSTYYLIAWIVSYSLSNLQYYLLDTGIVDFEGFYDYVYIAWPLLMPALIIMYCHTLLYPKRKISWGERLLFVPFILGFILGVSYKIFRAMEFKHEGLSVFFIELTPIGELLAILFSMIAIIYMLITVHRFQKKESYSVNKVSLQLNWFKITLILLFITTLIWAYSEIMYGDSDDISYFYPLWIIVAFLIYWLGHLGMYKYGINEQRKQIRKTVHDRYSITEVLPQKNEHITAMKQFLEGDRNFLDPNISLEAVATHLGISSGHLSKVINTELRTSFKDYLNKLRIKEAKLYLKDPDFSNYTLVAIGLEAGFNSKSAFNASFKKITGLTPSQFRQE